METESSEAEPAGAGLEAKLSVVVDDEADCARRYEELCWRMGLCQSALGRVAGRELAARSSVNKE